MRPFRLERIAGNVGNRAVAIGAVTGGDIFLELARAAAGAECNPGIYDHVHFAAGQTVPNLVLAKVSGAGTVCIYTLHGTHLVADVAGWFRE